MSTTIIINISSKLLMVFTQRPTSGFEARSAHQKSINVLFLCQVLAIFLTYWSTIDDASIIRSFLWYTGGEPFSDRCVYFLSLLGSCNLSRANRPNDIKYCLVKSETGKGAYGPDRFICNNNFRPIFRPISNRFQLGGDDFNGFVTLSLLKDVKLIRRNS